MAVMAETIDIIAACNIQRVTSGYEEIDVLPPLLDKLSSEVGLNGELPAR